MSDSSLVVVVSGASGLVGQALVAHLEAAGHAVRRLVRGEVRDSEREIAWNPSRGTIDAEELNAVDAVVHLSGESVAQRWTSRVKRRIRSSRVDSTLLLARTLAALPEKPRVLCCASAVGYYGDRGDTEVDERSPAGIGFLAEVARDWESAADGARAAGIRVCHARLGVVLDPAGGALPKMLCPFRWGLGGVLGSGRQYFSWITLPDAVRAFERTLLDESLVGPVNFTAPEAVTNRELTQALAQVLRRPAFLPAPAFALRLLLGEMADEMLLASTRAVPQALLEAGHAFSDPELRPALARLVGTTRE